MSSSKAPSAAPVVRLVIAWASLAVIVALALSIPAFIVMVALTQLGSALVTAAREDGRWTFTFLPSRQPLQSLLRLVPAAVFFALATIAFDRANTSIVGILLG